mgnify:CR=1
MGEPRKDDKFDTEVRKHKQYLQKQGMKETIYIDPTKMTVVQQPNYVTRALENTKRSGIPKQNPGLNDPDQTWNKLYLNQEITRHNGAGRHFTSYGVDQVEVKSISPRLYKSKKDVNYTRQSVEEGQIKTIFPDLKVI